MKIGLVADSMGDVDALEHACDFLVEEKGAGRLFFLGGRYTDVDDLLQRKREAARGGAAYSDADFLADVAAFVAKAAEAEKGGVAHRLNKSEVETYAARFTRVPDKDCLQYRDPNIARALPDMVGDRIAILVHDKADLTREDLEPATFLIHGASKEPAVVQIGPRYFVTPGRLCGGDPDGSFGLLELEAAAGLSFVAYGFDGREKRRVAMSMQTKTKMTVK
ncbi:MAG: hypothetical protein QM765_07175 [Myxococcales bacterium]